MARVPDLQAFCADARHPALLRLGPHRLPTPHRAADRARGGRQPADRRTATSPPSATARRSTASTTSRSCKGDVDGAADVLVRVHSRVRDGRRVRVAALRLRRAAAPRAARRSRRRARGVVLYLRAGGPRHRPAQQAPRLRAAGTAGSTPSRRTSSSASRPTCATTASARRSSPTSVSRTIRILTNNPRKIVGLEGLRPDRDASRCRSRPQPQEHNLAYLRVKATSSGTGCTTRTCASSRRRCRLEPERASPKT